MQATEAVKQIRNTIFKPGWKFSASWLSEYAIKVTCTISTVDTSYTDAAGNFFAPKDLSDDFTLNVRAMDEAALAYELLKFGMATNFHEDREFMKVRQPDGTWVAPLHPHTYAGENDWQRLGGAKGMLPADMDPRMVAMMRRIEELDRMFAVR